MRSASSAQHHQAASHPHFEYPTSRCGDACVIASLSAVLDARRRLRAEIGAPIRREMRREDSASTALDSGFTPERDNFTAFRDKNTQLNPTRLQFHSTFGCDFHRIEHVSSAQGV
jgi:hypothetical protein